MGLQDADPTVRHAAVHAVSVWRDKPALDYVIELLDDDSSHVQRATAEALGRLGNTLAIPKLLAKLEVCPDRILEHSLLYALIEIGSAEELRPALSTSEPNQQRAALLALHGMRDSELTERELAPLLRSRDEALRSLATRIAAQHPEWDKTYSRIFRSALLNRAPSPHHWWRHSISELFWTQFRLSAARDKGSTPSGRRPVRGHAPLLDSTAPRFGNA